MSHSTFSAILKVRTKKAALLEFAGGEVWVPLSVLSQDSAGELMDGEKGDSFDVEVADWFCEKEGIE